MCGVMCERTVRRWVSLSLRRTARILKSGDREMLLKGIDSQLESAVRYLEKEFRK
jgi:hypothetical protein